MRIDMGCDHAGYPLKEALKAFLTDEGHEVLDCGTDSEEMVDYPDFCAAAERWTRRPIWAQEPTSACESTIVSSST